MSRAGPDAPGLRPSLPAVPDPGARFDPDGLRTHAAYMNRG